MTWHDDCSVWQSQISVHRCISVRSNCCSLSLRSHIYAVLGLYEVWQLLVCEQYAIFSNQHCGCILDLSVLHLLFFCHCYLAFREWAFKNSAAWYFILNLGTACYWRFASSRKLGSCNNMVSHGKSSELSPNRHSLKMVCIVWSFSCLQRPWYGCAN